MEFSFLVNNLRQYFAIFGKYLATLLKVDYLLHNIFQTISQKDSVMLIKPVYQNIAKGTSDNIQHYPLTAYEMIVHSKYSLGYYRLSSGVVYQMRSFSQVNFHIVKLLIPASLFSITQFYQ